TSKTKSSTTAKRRASAVLGRKKAAMVWSGDVACRYPGIPTRASVCALRPFRDRILDGPGCATSQLLRPYFVAMNYHLPGARLLALVFAKRRERQTQAGKTMRKLLPLVKQGVSIARRLQTQMR